MSGEDAVGLGMAASFVIAAEQSAADVLTMGNFFTAIGTNLIVIGDARARAEAGTNAGTSIDR